MALAQQGAQVFAPAPASSAAPVNPTGQWARTRCGWVAGAIHAYVPVPQHDGVTKPVAIKQIWSVGV
jgi:hypothetical protein